MMYLPFFDNFGRQNHVIQELSFVFGVRWVQIANLKNLVALGYDLFFGSEGVLSDSISELLGGPYLENIALDQICCLECHSCC